ncbi:hypothetical protein AAW51_0396 [Caldimonas brevitalea]|uniref:Uncharacterized protein n=1 Tax=Caldimonas brevitalea TaxID=413882 RepID=A0A0G3BCN9_9BURK|nr:hypothetical protein AAW51_0396 [Caldimonas brevitalea]
MEAAAAIEGRIDWVPGAKRNAHLIAEFHMLLGLIAIGEGCNDRRPDVRLVVSREAEAFHLVLGGMRMAGVTLPDLGVFVQPGGVTLDYPMGSEWGEMQIEAFVKLLRLLTASGGSISVPWWGAAGDRAFKAAVQGPQGSSS